MNRNYHAEETALLEKLARSGIRPKMLLHSCCAPCSSHVVTYLRDRFDLTVFYYNPNISPLEEYEKRKSEQKRFLAEIGIPFRDCGYEGEGYERAVAGLEHEPERGARCEVCFALRLRRTAREAKSEGFEYYCTTLSVSPHKSAALLNELGERIGKEEGVPFFPSDFKKKGGYLRSVRLSEEYGLYRQDYCGCRFSRAEREAKR